MITVIAFLGTLALAWLAEGGGCTVLGYRTVHLFFKRCHCVYQVLFIPGPSEWRTASLPTEKWLLVSVDGATWGSSCSGLPPRAGPLWQRSACEDPYREHHPRSAELPKTLVTVNLVHNGTSSCFTAVYILQVICAFPNSAHKTLQFKRALHRRFCLYFFSPKTIKQMTTGEIS